MVTPSSLFIWISSFNVITFRGLETWSSCFYFGSGSSVLWCSYVWLFNVARTERVGAGEAKGDTDGQGSVGRGPLSSSHFSNTPACHSVFSNWVRKSLESTLMPCGVIAAPSLKVLSRAFHFKVSPGIASVFLMGYFLKPISPRIQDVKVLTTAWELNFRSDCISEICMLWAGFPPD